MKSDISRHTFNSSKHYNRVIMQQGRVQLDADWNEQQDILLHQIETRTSDTIGVSGTNEGFKISFTPDGNDLLISPGTMYVDGILCELEQEAAIPVASLEPGRISLNLADIDNRPFQAQHWAELLSANKQRLGLFKITHVDQDQENQRLVLSFDQSTFAPPYPNTLPYSVRPVTTYLSQPDYPNASNLPAPGEANNGYLLLAYLDVWQRQVTPFDDPAIREVALGGADTAQRSQTLWQVKVVPLESPFRELAEATRQHRTQIPQEKHDNFVQWISRMLRIATFTPPLSMWNAPTLPYTGRLNACLLPTSNAATGRYRGLENQLYHVEIHDGTRDKTIPKFKWARNNASLLVLASIENGAVFVQGSGHGSLLGLAVDQYVELVNEQTELLCLPGHLAKIKQVDDVTGQLTLDPPPPLQGLRQIRLRLWDGTGTIDGSQDGNVLADRWIALEGGLAIQFTQDGTYRSGDYWLIPARTSIGKIDWPHTAPQLPTGVRHRYTRLATLLHLPTLWLQQDCHSHFFPLASEALHIIDINWKNDTRNERHLLREGLRIILDGEPDRRYVGAMQAAMTVSLETALSGCESNIFLINGIFEIESNIITWRWDREEKLGLFAKFFARYNRWLSTWFDEKERYLRVRVTLRGHGIFSIVNGQCIYLDGEAFGIPGKEDSGHRPAHGRQAGRHIDLQFPSGAGKPASDFESWFYIKE